MMNLARSCGEASNEQCSTAQSSDSKHGGTSKVVNDGNKDMFSHTGYAENPWWRVDFGSTKQIVSGTIWNRADGVEARLDGFKIWIGDSSTYNGPANTNCYTATTTEHDMYPYYTHSFTCFGLGRYFFVHLPKTEWLNMREVEVLSRKPGVPGPGEFFLKDFRTGWGICGEGGGGGGEKKKKKI
jgi:hypothetical protein